MKLMRAMAATAASLLALVLGRLASASGPSLPQFDLSVPEILPYQPLLLTLTWQNRDQGPIDVWVREDPAGTEFRIEIEGERGEGVESPCSEGPVDAGFPLAG